jgi:hypothetical protein
VYRMESDGKYHHDLSGTTRKFLLFLAVLAVAAPLAGCGSGRATTVTVATPPVSTQPASTTASATATTTPTPPPPPAHPLVHFTNTLRYPHGVWPFTIQLASITESPRGFTGAGGAPPGDTYLMVQLNITSQVTGRMVIPPDVESEILCHGFHALPEGGGGGYDQGSSIPDPTGFYVALGDGRPHAWDQEWLVPEGTPISHVKCVFGPDVGDPAIAHMWVKAIGPTRLN